MFKYRSTEPERIDTGDYTPEEYERFLSEIAFINRYFGDRRALKKTLFREIENLDLREFSVLDVGCGSGELLRIIADFAHQTGRKATLTGIDLNPISAGTTRTQSAQYNEIESIRGDALQLPFADASFDYAISSLFFHHLTDEQITLVIREMFRVARRSVIIIDLERSVKAWLLYKLFCVAYRISPLVRHDGSLSIRKGFTTEEMLEFGRRLDKGNASVRLVAPYRVVFTIRKAKKGRH